MERTTKTIDSIRSDLINAHKDYAKLLQKKSDVRAEIVEIDRQLKEIRLRTEGTVAGETMTVDVPPRRKDDRPTTKDVPKYGNQALRDDETLRRLSRDEEYNQLQRRMNDAIKRSASFENDIAVIDMQCRNYRSVLDSYSSGVAYARELSENAIAGDSR